MKRDHFVPVAERCKEQIWRSGSWGHSGCSKRATRDGFCATHHPDAKKARLEKRDAAWKAKDAASRLRWAITAAESDVVAAALDWHSGRMAADDLQATIGKLVALKASR